MHYSCDISSMSSSNQSYLLTDTCESSWTDTSAVSGLLCSESYALAVATTSEDCLTWACSSAMTSQYFYAINDVYVGMCSLRESTTPLIPVNSFVGCRLYIRTGKMSLYS